MSSPVAGKFQDHYEVMGVDPRADVSTIERAYSQLSQQYHASGEHEKYEEVQQAWEILSDSVLRREFDKIKGLGEEKGPPKFSGIAFFDALRRGAGLRSALLCILYDRRRTKPFTPSISMRHIDAMVQAGDEELYFAVWYLKQRNFVMNDDKSSLQITVEGMDLLEANPPEADIVLRFMNPEALAEAPSGQPVPKMPPAIPPAPSPVQAVVQPAPTVEATPEPKPESSPESVTASTLSALRRAMSRV